MTAAARPRVAQADRLAPPIVPARRGRRPLSWALDGAAARRPAARHRRRRRRRRGHPHAAGRLAGRLHAQPGHPAARQGRQGRSRTFARERRVMLKEGEIPDIVEKAVLASEDSNFFQHGGIDAMGHRARRVADLRPAIGAGRLDDHHAAGAEPLPVAREDLAAQDRGGPAGGRAREELQQAADPHPLPEPGEPRARQLRHRGGVALLLRQAGQGAHPGRGGDPGRHHPGAQPLQPLQRRRDGAQAARPGAAPHDRGGLTSPRRSTTKAARTAAARRLAAGARRWFAPYFAEDVRKYLETKYGATSLYEEGLQVRTTLDPAIQRVDREALRQGLVRLDHRRGWRGPIDQLRRRRPQSLEQQELPTWGRRPPVPGRWVQGHRPPKAGRRPAQRSGSASRPTPWTAAASPGPAAASPTTW